MNKSERTIPFNLRREQEDLKHASAHHFEILMIILSISCQKPLFFIQTNIFQRRSLNTGYHYPLLIADPSALSGASRQLHGFPLN